jgi:hypothetical protein
VQEFVGRVVADLDPESPKYRQVSNLAEPRTREMAMHDINEMRKSLGLKPISIDQSAEAAMPGQSTRRKRARKRRKVNAA